MNSTVEPAEGNKVKVAVEVPEAELEPAMAQAWREIAKEVRLPGFRPGKAPRKLLERQLGTAYARSEALRNALPEFYSQAVIEHDVDVIAAPELDITGGEEEGDVSFSAVVEVRPEVKVAGYDGLRVEVPSPTPDDAEVDEQIDRLRSQHGELAVVERQAGDQDYVSIDIEGSADGEPVDGLTADGYLYLVGSGMIVPELDEHLLGTAAGDVVTFTAAHPDPEQGEVDFEVRVRDVQERVLPELDDEWVADATEFETVEELRTDTLERLSSERREQTRQAVRANLGRELAQLVDEDAPEAMVSQEVQTRLQNLVMSLQQRGIRLEDYLQITGRDPEAFTDELRESAAEAVKVDLALRAVAQREGIEVTQEQLDEEIADLIGGAGISIEEATEQLRTGGQLSAVRSEVAKRSTLEWLIEHTDFVDPDGRAIDEELLAAPDHDHDHDHDHDGAPDATGDEDE